jgi:hypothetical protein
MAHQTLDCAPRRWNLFAIELLPHFLAAVDLIVCVPDPTDLNGEVGIAVATRTLPPWLT